MSERKIKTTKNTGPSTSRNYNYSQSKRTGCRDWDNNDKVDTGAGLYYVDRERPLYLTDRINKIIIIVLLLMRIIITLLFVYKSLNIDDSIKLIFIWIHLIWVIPTSYDLIEKMNKNYVVTNFRKIVIFIFVDPITGILLFFRKEK